MTQLFSVIDIETNGGSKNNVKITEIAILVTDGKKIIKEFSSLVNPESKIPPFIASLTGITNEMVENAPKFYEIAAEIVEITENTVFVAHNSGFDYNIVKQEFASLAYNYKRNTLCTLQLSRKLLPGHKSYSLGNLCADLGIDLQNRHRAFGDAKATTILFHKLFKHDYQFNQGENINGFSINGLNQNLNISKIKNLPEKCGVYYFYNTKGEVIYIGKSKNLKSRILQHLKNEKTNKALNMRAEIADIDYELTGCELIALLKESHEIKQNKPKFNKAQRRFINNWGIFTFENEKGYIEFYVKNSENCEADCLNVYPSRNAAIEVLFKLCEKYNLCQKLCGLYQFAGACFYHGLNECKGACCGKENQEDYNKRAEKLIQELSLGVKNAFIIFENCDDNQRAVISIAKNKYQGYALLDKEFDFSQNEIIESIEKYPDNKDIRQIIKTYLKINKDYKLVSL